MDQMEYAKRVATIMNKMTAIGKKKKKKALLLSLFEINNLLIHMLMCQKSNVRMTHYTVQPCGAEEQLSYESWQSLNHIHFQFIY